jgi:LacI family transcriptional regulator
VLSGKPFVGAETRKRVERAVADLEFQPNRLARALVRDRTDTVGMVIPDVTNPFFAELIRGAEDELSNAGYAAVLGNSDNDAEKERRYLDNLREQRVDGLIVAIASESDAGAVLDLAASMPTVIVDRTLPGWTGDSVVGDNQAGMALAVQHLVDLGHTEIGLVGGDPSVSTARDRRGGFEQALHVAGLRAAAISQGSYTFQSGYDQAMALLGAPHRPTAICAANDLLALAVLAAADELGVRIPEQVSVVGYDDIAYARLAAPSLTTIRQLAQDMGQAAARLLLDRVSDSTMPKRRIVMLPELIVRRSTAPPYAPARERTSHEAAS